RPRPKLLPANRRRIGQPSAPLDLRLSAALTASRPTTCWTCGRRRRWQTRGEYPPPTTFRVRLRPVHSSDTSFPPLLSFFPFLFLFSSLPHPLPSSPSFSSLPLLSA